MPILSPSYRETFWSRVTVTEPGECWLWTAGRSITRRRKDGTPAGEYGAFRGDRAHRVAFRIGHAREIPDGMVVRHKCDNSLCCNPAHLELGTVRDNMRDATERRRMARGEKHHAQKLTDAQVADAIARYDAGETGSALADEFGVPASTLYGLIARNR